VSNAVDRSRRMRTDDLEAAFVICRASVTDSNAVSVECPFLKPDWLTSSWLFRDRKDDWLKAIRSSVLKTLERVAFIIKTCKITFCTELSHND